MSEENETMPSRRRILRSRPVLWLILLVAGFLAGFLWQFTRAQRLQSELDKMKQSADAYARESFHSSLRDEISLAYLEVTRKNYGLAGEHSTKYFDILRVLISTNQDPRVKQEFENILSMRDRVTAGLASADPAAVELLQQLLLKTFQTTIPPGELVAK
jgi:hypothetical protein